MGRKVTVYVDGEKFNTVKDAAHAIGASPMYLSNAIHAGKTVIKDHIISVEETSLITRKAPEKCGREGIPVYCTTTGEVFESISAAAKTLGINSWTMGLKMHTAGKFIDKNGNEYIREKPINTDKVYNNTGYTLNPRKYQHRKVTEALEESTNTVKVPSESSEINSLVSVAKTFINKGKYSEASDLLAVINKISQ